jgi:uncharacterized protein (DUF1330 family)
MAGMWIAQVNVTDQETYGRYVAKAGEVLKAHGATFLARGGHHQQMEGSEHVRIVIATFPRFQDAVECYNSEAYQAIMGDAIAGSERSIVIVETND